MRYLQRIVGVQRIKRTDDKTVLFGCYNGDYETYKDQVLTRAVRYKHRKYPDDWDKDPEIIEERQVHITIRAIHAYGKELDMAGQGLGCVLALEGDDLDWLNEEWCFE